MGLYTGFDLHSSNTYVGIIDEDGKRIRKKKLRNDPSLISATLRPFKEDIAEIVLGLTIMMETGPIERFAEVGNYVSYCRKVPAARFSNDKKKGTSNRKNGNKYLSWAYAEAAELARRSHSAARDQEPEEDECTDRTQCACAQTGESGVLHHEGWSSVYVWEGVFVKDWVLQRTCTPTGTQPTV